MGFLEDGLPALDTTWFFGSAPDFIESPWSEWKAIWRGVPQPHRDLKMVVNHLWPFITPWKSNMSMPKNYALEDEYISGFKKCCHFWGIDMLNFENFSGHFFRCWISRFHKNHRTPSDSNCASWTAGQTTTSERCHGVAFVDSTPPKKQHLQEGARDPSYSKPYEKPWL